MLQRLWRRLAGAAPDALRGRAWPSARSSGFAPDLKTASIADVASAHWLLLGRAMDRETREGYVARLARRPLRFEELAEELLHSPEFTTRFGRLVPSAGDEVVEVAVEGVIVLLRRSDVLISGPVLSGHPHEPHVWAALEALLLPGTTFVDVGANVGLFALPAAPRVGPSGRVIAVEPRAENVQLLCAAAVRNRFANFDVMPFAASDRRGVLAVVTRQETTNSFTPPDRAVRPEAPCAPCAPLDELLGGRGRIDVVKIDVEGHEPAVVAGSREILGRYRPAMLVEFNPAGLETNFGQDPPSFAEWLVEYGGGQVAVIQRGVEALACASGRDLMRAWTAANARLGFEGRLHVDVLAKPARPAGMHPA